jgi:tetratricopeptide (TPR) repeat protein
MHSGWHHFPGVPDMNTPSPRRLLAAIRRVERDNTYAGIGFYAVLLLACLLVATGCGSASKAPTFSPPPVVMARNAISGRLLAKDAAGAVAAARDAEARFPEDAVVALMAAEAHQGAGDAAAALASLDRAVRFAASGVVRDLALRNRAALLMRAGRPAEALADLKVVLADGLADEALLLDACAAAWAAGDFEALRQAWQCLPLEAQLKVEKVVGREVLLHAVALAAR